MKVLMTADTVGGVWTYAVQLAHALRAHGVEVHLATMGAPLTPAQWAEAGQTPNLTIYESAYKLEWMDDPWGDVAGAGEWLLDLERTLRPDVVHLNSYAHGALAWRAPVLVVGHSCVLSWWEAVRGISATPEWDHYRREVQAGLQAANLVVAPTKAMLHALEKHYSPLPQSRAIYNGRDAALFRPAPKESFVLAVGRLWDEAKNVGAVAAVASQLPWPVYVAGEARHPNGGQAQLGGAQPLGKLSPSELASWYGKASIYAHPARYEPFGLSALEAGLAGCALVLGDIPTLREVWGDAALFVSPDDRWALREAIMSLIEDAGMRERLAARARAKALEYSTGRMAKAYVRAYRELLARYATGITGVREGEDVLTCV